MTTAATTVRCDSDLDSDLDFDSYLDDDDDDDSDDVFVDVDVVDLTLDVELVLGRSESDSFRPDDLQTDPVSATPPLLLLLPLKLRSTDVAVDTSFPIRNG